MQLSIVSWVFFGLGILIIASVIALWAYTVTRAIQGKSIGDLYTFIIILTGVFFLVLGVVIVGLISAGGMRAHDIKHDLTNQGYTVFDIETNDNTAIVLIDGYTREVQVINDGVSWKPYISCQILPDGEIVDQLRACHVVNSNDGI